MPEPVRWASALGATAHGMQVARSSGPAFNTLQASGARRGASIWVKGDTMASQVRRVVTGHNADGKAVVAIDDTIELAARRPGSATAAAVVWTTEGFPVDNTTTGDAGQREVGITLANGTVFRVVEFGPGNAPFPHRTDSIDYAVVMSGEIDMELEGEVVHLKAGDVLVQRGTMHTWINKGSAPCTIAFVLIDAKSVEVGGRVLHATA
jgi:quercetin dioxygenase-like cupin family protein